MKKSHAAAGAHAAADASTNSPAVADFDPEDARSFAESLARSRHRVGPSGIRWGNNGCPHGLVGYLERIDYAVIGLASLVDVMAAEQDAMEAGRGFLGAHALHGVTTAAQVLSREACDLVYRIDTHFTKRCAA